MAITAAQVSVGETATLVVQAGVAGLTVTVTNPSGGADVFLGDAGVDVSNGYNLEAGESVQLLLTPGDGLYGIVATGAKVVHVLGA